MLCERKQVGNADSRIVLDRHLLRIFLRKARVLAGAALSGCVAAACPIPPASALHFAAQGP